MRSSRRQHGVALFETALAAVAAAVLGLGFQGVVSSSDGLSSRTSAQGRAYATHRRALEGIGNTLRGADAETLSGFDLLGVANSVQFQKVTGITSTARLLAPAATITWQSTAPVEGLIDPGEIVLVEGTTRTTLATRVPRGGFTVTDVGTGLRIHLETCTPIAKGETARANGDLFVSFRN